jgi:hypothetical protein
MILARVSSASADIDQISAQAVCTKLGLTPETVTVLGLNAQQTQLAFQRLDDAESSIDLLEQREQQRQALMTELTEAKRMIRFAESQSEDQLAQQQIEQLQAQISSLEGTIRSLQTEIRATFLGLSHSAQIEQVCIPSGLSGLLPAEFRVIELRPEDYSEIFAALLAEQRAIDEGTQPDTDTQLTLSRYRNLPAVQQARSNLLYNLDAVRGAFSNRLNPN